MSLKTTKFNSPNAEKATNVAEKAINMAFWELKLDILLLSYAEIGNKNNVSATLLPAHVVRGENYCLLSFRQTSSKPSLISSSLP